MSISIKTRTEGEHAPVAEYQPAYVFRGTIDPDLTLDMPAKVLVELGRDITLTLDVNDARLLAYELDRAVAVHDATCAADPGKAVA